MEKQYYFSNGTDQYGPYSFSELGTKNITQQQLFWFEGLPTWKRGHELPRLNSLFNPQISTPLTLTQQDTLSDYPAYKLYKNNAILVGTFLGGPLAAAYFITENFKKLGHYEHLRKIWLYSIGAVIILWAIGYVIDDLAAGKTYSYAIPFSTMWLVSYLFQQYQGPQIETHQQKGGQFYSIGNAILVGLIGLAITVVAIFVIAMLFIVLTQN